MEAPNMQTRPDVPEERAHLNPDAPATGVAKSNSPPSTPRQFRPCKRRLNKKEQYQMARDYARSLDLPQPWTKKGWENWCSDNPGRLKIIPSRPDKRYPDQWEHDWSLWMGAPNPEPKRKKPNPKFLSYEDAQKYAHTLKLKTQKEWRIYCRTSERPSNIPAAPDKTYKDEGWQGFGPWLNEPAPKSAPSRAGADVPTQPSPQMTLPPAQPDHADQATTPQAELTCTGAEDSFCDPPEPPPPQQRRKSSRLTDAPCREPSYRERLGKTRFGPRLCPKGSVTVKETTECGLHLVATRDIRAGSIITQYGGHSVDRVGTPRQVDTRWTMNASGAARPPLDGKPCATFTVQTMIDRDQLASLINSSQGLIKMPANCKFESMMSGPEWLGTWAVARKAIPQGQQLCVNYPIAPPPALDEAGQMLDPTPGAATVGPNELHVDPAANASSAGNSPRRSRRAETPKVVAITALRQERNVLQYLACYEEGPDAWISASDLTLQLDRLAPKEKLAVLNMQRQLDNPATPTPQPTPSASGSEHFKKLHKDQYVELPTGISDHGPFQTPSFIAGCQKTLKKLMANAFTIFQALIVGTTKQQNDPKVQDNQRTQLILGSTYNTEKYKKKEASGDET